MPGFSSKAFREMQLLKAVYARGEMTRTELADATGLTAGTVARLVNDLAHRNLLSTAPRRDGHLRGRPSEVITLSAQAGHVAGLEFGRDHLAVTILDAAGNLILHEQEVSAPEFIASQSTLDQLIARAKDSAARAGVAWDSVLGIGLALHDVVTADGSWLTIDRPDAPPCPAKEHLERRTGRTVVVEDVSRAFAEAEHRHGAGRQCPDMIYMFIGSHGVGGGIFLNGRMLKSASGICGEIGHIIVDEDGELCQCGSRGCLETAASHTRIIEQFLELRDQGVATTLGNRASVRFAEICRAAGEGDKAAYLVLHNLARRAGAALASAVNITGAPVIVIGGHLRLAGSPFLHEVSAALRQRVVAQLAREISVRYAELPAHAGAWGVSIQALDAAWSSGTFLTHQTDTSASGWGLKEAGM